MLLEYLNSLACLILLGFALVAAILMNHRGHWGSKGLMFFGVVATGLNCISPWIEQPVQLQTSAVLMNVTFALLSLVWRREIMQFIRVRLAPPPSACAPVHQLRRQEDLRKIVGGMTHE
jgi:hypothetical protein